MRRTELLQEVREMRFEEVLEIWTKRDITQEEAARMLGVSDRTFRRYIGRYEDEGLDALYLIIFFSHCEERKRRGNLLDKWGKQPLPAGSHPKSTLSLRSGAMTGNWGLLKIENSSWKG